MTKKKNDDVPPTVAGGIRKDGRRNPHKMTKKGKPRKRPLPVNGRVVGSGRKSRAMSDKEKRARASARRTKHAHQIGVGGHELRLDAEITEEIAGYIAAGNYPEVAAAFAGISRTTFYEWMRRGRKEADKGRENVYTRFSVAVRRAEAQAEVEDIKRIRQDDSWQARAWLRERKNPERWGRRVAVDANIKAELSLAQIISQSYEVSGLPEAPRTAELVGHDQPALPDATVEEEDEAIPAEVIEETRAAVAVEAEATSGDSKTEVDE